jgi:hypothetical protein
VQRLSLDNLDGLTGLAGLADRSGVDIRPTLLRVLTDLYTQKQVHTSNEDQHFTELALRLIEVVDPGTRHAVEAKLKKHPHVPAAVIERLEQLAPRKAEAQQPGSIELFNETSLDDDLDIFEPMAPSLQPLEVADHKQVVAQAPQPDDYIAQREAFFSASAEERKLILLNLDPVAEQDVPLAQGTNLIRYLEQAALAGRAQEFTTLMQQALGVSRALSRRIMTDAQGEPFVVSAKAMAMPTDVFQRILMSLNPTIGQSVERVFELSDLFLELPLPSALHLVAIWRAADRIEAKNVLHRRAHWDEAPLPVRRNAAHDESRDSTSPTINDPLRRHSSGG